MVHWVVYILAMSLCIIIFDLIINFILYKFPYIPEVKEDIYDDWIMDNKTKYYKFSLMNLE